MCSCFRVIGCCCCCLFLVFALLCLMAVYFYAVYVPHVPTYEVTRMEVKAFDLQPDLILSAEILMTVRASNPNSNIGFIYGHNGIISVVFNESDVLCWGKPPPFQQGHDNVTIVKVHLVGKNHIGPGFQAAYEENQKNQKPVPLVVKVQMPIKVVLEEVPLREFTAYVNSSLLVDNLNPSMTTNIVSSDTAFHFEF